MLFHRHAWEALSEDALLELADWSVRKLTYLNSPAAAQSANATGTGTNVPGSFQSSNRIERQLLL